MIYLLIWLLIAIISIAIELCSPGFFYFLALACGACAAAVASLWMTGAYSVMIAIMVSIASLGVLRLYVYRVMHKTSARTNADLLIGKLVMVTQEIRVEHPGRIQYAGESWVAYCSEQCHEGERVEIVRVVRAHVIVKKLS